MDQEQTEPSITCLPDEIIAHILRNIDCIEIIKFGSTCKKFYDLVYNHQLLWKHKLRDIIPKDQYGVVVSKSEKTWLEEVKLFYNIKKEIFTELLLMSPRYYWQGNQINFEEVNVFFNIALSNNVSYYYTIHILQELIKKGNECLKNFNATKPYTLTDMYYAKIVLRHLMNTYLTVKWVQGHINEKLTPEFVVNFFVQWVDSMNMHNIEDVENIITKLVAQVEKMLVPKLTNEGESGNQLKAMCEKGQIPERQILTAITKVIYHQPHMAITGTANLDTLDVVKVMENKCGNMILLGALYQAVARRCGVVCNLVAFPNHLFLEWQDPHNSRNQKFKIDLNTGEIQPKRGCPFSGHLVRSDYKYSPDSLLQFIVASFSSTMGAIHNWYMQNATYLVEFMNMDSANFNPYNKFLRILMDHTHQPNVSTPIDIKYFQELNRQIILLLIQYAHFCNTVRPMQREVIVQRHDSRVKYAVGMLCYHKRSEYICIIRGWDLSCASQWRQISEVNSLHYGLKQPFYHVVAADQSNRYVAQENLIEVLRPSRLYHLEDIIAGEFSHFNGFYYVPNDEKLSEYPDDNSYVSVFQNRADMMATQSARTQE